MREYALSRFLGMGATFRYLQDIKVGWPVHPKNGILQNLQRFLKFLEILGLKVTLNASKKLQSMSTELEKYSPDAGISLEDGTRLSSLIIELSTTLKAETSTLKAYVLTDKKMTSDLDRLVERPESFLSAQTFGKLPSVAQYDLRQAGKCIAFEIPTAAAFHLLRATEDALRSYQAHFIKKTRKLNPTWADLITSLKAKRRSPLPIKTLLNHLDHMRDSFRNPTNHPEKIYDMDEVQDLFGLVADVLNRIAKELP